MENNLDIQEELKNINHELYINKLIIDLENAMESLLLFYGNYCDTQKQEMKSKIIGDKENNVIPKLRPRYKERDYDACESLKCYCCCSSSYDFRHG